MQNKIKYQVIVDTREKVNEHIVNKFIENNIDYKLEKLNIGDYAIVDVNGYMPKIVIERKASLDELLQNLIDRNSLDEESQCNRFHRELIKAEALGIRVILLLENSNWYSDILKHNYRSKVKPAAAKGLIVSLQAKYPNLSIVGIDKGEIASYIYSVLYYSLREELKLT